MAGCWPCLYLSGLRAASAMVAEGQLCRGREQSPGFNTQTLDQCAGSCLHLVSGYLSALHLVDASQTQLPSEQIPGWGQLEPS